jgi:hypothetical protein
LRDLSEKSSIECNHREDDDYCKDSPNPHEAFFIFCPEDVHSESCLV